MRHYQGDPYWLQARFNSTCPKCNKQIKRGEDIFYYPKGKKAFCKTCGDSEYRHFMSAAHDEEVYHGGAPYAN